MNDNLSEMNFANSDAAELAKFEAMAPIWWDKNGVQKPLHDINVLRVDYINTRAPLAGKNVLDVGCGGGILSESMAAMGAVVTGIDASPAPLAVAKLHLKESGVRVDYQMATAEMFAAEHSGRFDVVTCLELLEHVPEPASVVSACQRLAKPGGDILFATLNRNLKSLSTSLSNAMASSALSTCCAWCGGEPTATESLSSRPNLMAGPDLPA